MVKMAEEKDYNKLLIENNPRMSVMNFFRKLKNSVDKESRKC